jgi:hypothetical protein
MFRSINPFIRHATPISSPLPFYLNQNAKLTRFSRLDVDGRLGFSWSGAHPRTKDFTSFVHVENRSASLDGTHLFYVGARRGGSVIRLYDRQADMDIIGYSANDAAAIVGAGLVRFLLTTKDPRNVPGLIHQVTKGGVSPWSDVFQTLRIGLIKQQLDRYQIPIAAYKATPAQYNAIKDSPTSNQ